MKTADVIKILGEAEFSTHRDADYAISVSDAIEYAINVLRRQEKNEYLVENITRLVNEQAQAKAKSEKYRWHDLSIDKDDYPNDGDYIVCCYESRLNAPEMYEIGEYCDFGKIFPNIDEYDMEYWDVRAWKIISFPEV